ncbi:MAG: Gfo/Idh/MocA family oxidoreductase [Burkholderiales bacterium]|nr:Gfo/Idh/MocA family oxidoreductase [Anaerolineae bacterium]
MSVQLPFELDYKPHLGTKTDYGIGFCGTGGIVQYAHIPAYKRVNFNMVACYDLNVATAKQVAAQHFIPNAYGSLDELLADPAVDIVDIAVPPWEQLAVVEKVAAAGKHMLCQKPLSQDFNEAKRIVELAKEAGVKQAINQQMRWDAGIRASKDLINRGIIGQPTDAQIQVSVLTPWHMWPWLAAVPGLEVMFHSIHYIDAIRYLFGNPEWVTSRHARYAKQGIVKGETKTVTVMDYADGLQALVSVNHYNAYAEPFATFRFIGTEGAITGTIGLMYNYPAGRPDTIEITSEQFGAGVKITPTLDELWIPDAFVGTMASLMIAIETDSTPQDNSTDDNLNTLRVVNAAYRSAAENRSVRFDEIQ